MLVNAGVNTLPLAKIGGPTEPTIPFARAVMTDNGGFPEIIIPAGFNQVVYEPQFALSADNTSYSSVTGTVQSLLRHPLPFSIMFWAGAGEEPALIEVASTYEAATNHRVPPPAFGPVPGEP